MKNLYLLAVFMVVLLLIPATHASLKNWDIVIGVNDDMTTDWLVKLIYDQNITKSDYFVFGDISNVEVTGNGKPLSCKISKDIGTSVVCDKISSDEVIYKFKAYELVNYMKDFKVFKYRFPVTTFSERFSVTIKLPLGSFIADKNKLMGTGIEPFEPNFGKEGSDGRSIFVNWELDKPEVGRVLDVTLIYEQSPGFEVLTVAVPIFIAFFAALFAIFLLLRKRSVRHILPILTEAERRVVEMVMREKKGIDQRMIVKETEFSKAKVSRIIKDLENRGLIEKMSKGRTNIIKMRRGAAQEKV